MPTVVSGLDHGAVALGVGYCRACAVTAASGASCWGCWDRFENDSRIPAGITGLSSGITQIATAFTNTCALTTSGGAFCWGHDDAGQLGDGTPSMLWIDAPRAVVGLTEPLEQIVVGAQDACGLTVSGGVLCWGSNDYGGLGIGADPGDRRLSPTPVIDLGSGVVAISKVDSTMCARTADGRMFCWGSNAAGQLGNGSAQFESNVPVAVMAP